MSYAYLQQAQPASPGGGAPQGPTGSGQAPPPGSMWSMLIPLLMFVPILFLMFRRQKKEQEARSKLKKGDRVVTNAGLIGELMEMDERVAKVKIAPGTTVQVLVAMLSPFGVEADKPAVDAKPATDKK